MTKLELLLINNSMRKWRYNPVALAVHDLMSEHLQRLSNDG